ncbi:hypothetical protein L8U58_09675 [Corynebacterium sp. c9Ua_112]|uniref:Pentapeptide MXKDX repeat protein n=1 Tax=Corynebacterium macclintockiae TaxID=2913501 RepID=A0A9X3M899_9CORY|nr:hypothetical protein [Corynebacterium macclintockiae]MCZ9305784.1 hypothetical protein [Corynebacterium macclintockiae]
MNTRKTNRGNNTRATGFSVGRAAVAVALTGVMGLGLVACNEGNKDADKSETSSSSEMTSESKMTEEKMSDDKMTGENMTEEKMGGDKMEESGAMMSEKMDHKMGEKMSDKMDGKMEDKVENMMETDESMMPDLQGKHNH